MLGRLFKYDMKSMLRQFVPLWILAPFVATMLGLSMRGSSSSFLGNIMHRSSSEVLVMIMALIFSGVMIALVVMTILFVIQRFWNGLLKEEGYLMFTLPVETWELITSKGLAATLVTVVSIVSAVVSFALMILCTSQDILSALGSELDSIMEVLFRDYYSGQYWAKLILGILIGVFSIMKSIYQIYAAMAIGHLASRHRIAASCVAYVGINAVLSTIAALFMGFADDYQYEMQEMFGASGMLAGLVIVLAVTVVQIVIFHLITEKILDTRLNLE